MKKLAEAGERPGKTERRRPVTQAQKLLRVFAKSRCVILDREPAGLRPDSLASDIRESGT